MSTPTTAERVENLAAAWQGMNWIRKEKRLAIYMRDGFACQYCGTDLRNALPGQLTLDHLKPRSEGGKNGADNLVTACGRCNYSRQAKDWRAFAPGGAIARIEHQIQQPLNVRLAKAIMDGTAGDPRAEALR